MIRTNAKMMTGKKWYQIGFFLLAFVMLTLPLVNETNAQDDSSTGTLYVYRTKAFQGALVNVRLFINGQLIAKIPNGGRVQCSLKTEGVMELMIKETILSASLTLPIQAGQDYYVELGYNSLATALVINQVDPSVGKAMFNNTARFNRRGIIFYEENPSYPLTIATDQDQPQVEEQKLASESRINGKEDHQMEISPAKVEKVPSQAPPTQPSSQKRLALVIGNSDYVHGGALANPVNDARDMATTLRKVGFEVMKYENASRADMKRAIDSFGKKLKTYDVGLFYYAGHGIQSKGNNYLIPVEADLQQEEQVEYDCIRADRILSFMEGASSDVNIIILDACRNNPFERSWSRSGKGSGLAFMDAPSGSLIAYATSPGRTASDGIGDNGLYTESLLKYLQTPGTNILEVFQKVRIEVVERSSKQQTPWESTSLTGNFYFVK